MPNEVVIHVTSRNEVSKGFMAARKDVETFADDSADVYTKRFAHRMEELGRNLASPLSTSGRDMGERLGNSSAGEITRVIERRITETLPEMISRGLTSGGGIALYRTAGETVGQTVGESAGGRAGDRMSEEITDRITRRIKTKIRTVGDDISGDSGHAGERIGEDISRTIHTKIKDKIKTSVDVDTDGSIRSKAEKLGEEIGDKVGGGMGASLQAFFSGDLISLLVKVIAGGALVAALAPVLGAAISSAVFLGLGGGVLAAGIVSAAKDPKIAGAFTDLKTKVSGLFAEFGKPFRAPLLDFLVGKSGKDGLVGFIDSITPKLSHLAEVFAPIAGQLGTGLIALLQNATPGILKAAEAAAPLFEVLAKHMPEIGKAIGKFFDEISENGDDAALFFGDMLKLIEKIIPVIGKLISFLTSMYSEIRNMAVNGIRLFNDLRDAWMHGVDVMKAGFLSLLGFAMDIFGKILAGASEGLSWIPGIGPKLRAAQEKFNHFREGVNKELRKITDKDIKIRFRVFGQAAANAAVQTASVLASLGYAHGGIKGAASGMVAGGLTWVGERGPELVSLPTGSTVHSNGDSMRMASQGGQGGAVNVIVTPAAGIGHELVNALLTILRFEVDRNGNGSVATLLNRPGVTA